MSDERLTNENAVKVLRRVTADIKSVEAAWQECLKEHSEWPEGMGPDADPAFAFMLGYFAGRKAKE